MVQEEHTEKKKELKKVFYQRDGELDPSYRGITIVFKCRDECQTILDSAHIKEMVRFIAKAVDDEAWPAICRRTPGRAIADGGGCSEDAYQNLTHFIEPFLDKVTDLTIQSQIAAFAGQPDRLR